VSYKYSKHKANYQAVQSKYYAKIDEYGCYQEYF